MASLMQRFRMRFAPAKELFRDQFLLGKAVTHRAQSPVRQIKYEKCIIISNCRLLLTSK